MLTLATFGGLAANVFTLLILFGLLCLVLTLGDLIVNTFINILNYAFSDERHLQRLASKNFRSGNSVINHNDQR